MSTLDPGFEQLLEYVCDARGFDYTPYRRPTLMRRFEKRMQSVGAETWDAYREFLDGHPDEFGELFNAILINVTGFFRDRDTWDLIAKAVIPALLDRKSPEASIRCWSAGCASGEEAYTIAMLLADALGDEAFKERVRIYATDIDEQALTEARDATYTVKDVGDVHADLKERYFQQTNNHGFAFRADLRRCVIFGRNDLLKDPPISRVDLLVSRNTLMYFSPDAQQRVLANFHFALNHDAFLVVGKAEALQGARQLFTPYDLKRRVFIRDGASESLFRFARVRLPAEPRREFSLSELGDAAFEHAPIAQLVIDDENRVVALNQATRAMFGLKLKDVGRYLQDMEISYRPVELRSLIDEVRERKRSATEKGVEWSTEKGEVRSLDVQVSPLAGADAQFVGVGVSFIDVTTHRTLEDHLERARRELESAYEELQSTVEELETTNEELQSTNEELETTNEELQSTNEELETMNEELQSTNEELETMNDELRDRTEETLYANTFLSSVLSSIDQTVVVVDRALRIVGWNQHATELWGLRDDEVDGEHLLNLDIGLPVAKLRDSLRLVLAGEIAEDVELDGHNRRGQSMRFAITFAPLKGTIEGEPEGAILLLAVERADV
jgi:two-component system CheB/CheR fusion protein